jgi:hypothetical protein
VKRVIYIDVDDTLVRTAGTKTIPMTGVIAEIHRLASEGVDLYLWSSAGAEYARTSAVELGIVHCFVAFLPKPHAYIDDQPVHQWRYCQYIRPGNADQA